MHYEHNVNSISNANDKGNELESEIEARQAQGAESVRGVHEQVIRLVDNMVQNYLGNMRRAVQRFTNFIDNRRAQGQSQAQGQAVSSQPRHSPSVEFDQGAVDYKRAGEVIVNQLQSLTKGFREFTLQWSKTLGKQQSPLIDRIPPRGVELWRDFWDTVRKQVRRINQEFLQLTRDMGRVLTGRVPSTGGVRVVVRPSGNGREQEDQAEQQNNLEPAASGLAQLLYSSAATLAQSEDQTQEQIKQQFQVFYERLTNQLSKEQQKMNELSKAAGDNNDQKQQQLGADELLDELDDEITRQELANNVALRQQIQQEINVFGSIFDIMRAFIQRLRDSATTIRDILTPPGAINDNNSVTPGPAIKPTVDKLLEDTINSQRNINSQARPSSRD